MTQNDVIQMRPKRNIYDPSETAEIRRDSIRKAVSVHRLFMNREYVSLSDFPKVKETATAYIEACENAGFLPNFEGLAGALGISRQYIYLYLSTHPESETGKYLESIRTQWASLRMQLSENKILDPATSIFILKNSGLGFADRIDIAPAEPISPLHDLDAQAASKRILEALPDDDE